MSVSAFAIIPPVQDSAVAIESRAERRRCPTRRESARSAASETLDACFTRLLELREIRRALLDDRGDRLARLRAGEPRPEVGGLAEDGVLDRRRLPLAQQLLRIAHRAWRQGRERA